MPKLKKVGFFRELHYCEGEEDSIYNYLDSLPKDGEEIISYLSNGTRMIASPGTEEDIMNKNKNIIGGVYFKTDGIWIWPGSLMYYLQTYKIGLPKEFVDHVRKNNYICPVLSNEEIQQLYF